MVNSCRTDLFTVHCSPNALRLALCVISFVSFVVRPSDLFWVAEVELRND